MKTIGWISDFERFGGAEDSERYLIFEAPSGVKIHKIIGGKDFKTDCDLYIVNNFRRLTPIQLNFIIDTKKYILAHRDIIDTPHDNLFRRLARQAKINIFLSPLHREEFYKKFGVGVYDNNCCIAPCFDKRFYYRIEQEDRELDVCWVGNIQHHKGIEDVLLWARNNDRQVAFYGKGDDQIIDQIEESKYGKYMFECNAMELRDIYPTYKNFIHFPDKIEAFGRSCMEAFLSGCNMIVNEKVGMYSYPEIKILDRKKLEDWLELQPVIFWNTVNTYL